MSCTGGGILHEQAYAQGKMLDSGGWNGEIGRGGTPSDIDCILSQGVPHVFANRGRLLFLEFSRHSSRWSEINNGQKWVYESLSRYQSPRKEVGISILCKHSVPSDKAIKTDSDVDSFQAMWWSNGLKTSLVFSGDRWVGFVRKWFADPEKVMAYLEKNQENPV